MGIPYIYINVKNLIYIHIYNAINFSLLTCNIALKLKTKRKKHPSNNPPKNKRETKRENNKGDAS